MEKEKSVADAERKRLSEVYQDRLDRNASDVGNVDWGRLEGAAHIVNTLRSLPIGSPSAEPCEKGPQ